MTKENAQSKPYGPWPLKQNINHRLLRHCALGVRKRLDTVGEFNCLC